MKKITDEVVSKWVELNKSGKSKHQIAMDYGVSDWLVENRFKRIGYVRVWKQGELSEHEKSWIAAVIDCEGLLTVHLAKNKKSKYRAVQVFCRVQMANNGVPEKLFELCGGSFRQSGRVSTRGDHYCYWNITSNGLRWLLPQIHPYMIVKRRHSEIVMYILNKNKRNCLMQDSEFVPLFYELRILNRKGFPRGIPDVDQVLIMRKPEAAS